MKKLIVLVLCCGLSSVQAATMIFLNDESGFNNAINGLDGTFQTDNYDDITGPTGTTFTVPSPLVRSGYTVTQELDDLDVTRNPTSNIGGAGSTSLHPASVDGLFTFTFDTGINAFSIQFSDYEPAADGEVNIYEFSIDGGGFMDIDSSLIISLSGVNFLSIYDNVGTFTSIAFRREITDSPPPLPFPIPPPSDGISYDNLRFGSFTTPVPVPPAILLMLSGLAILFRRGVSCRK